MATAEPLLEAADLHRSYERRLGRGGSRRVEAVAGVNIRLEPGEALGVVGGSGSGKSTLARLLLALERPDRGTVEFDGHRISEIPESKVRSLRRQFQAVFQDPSTSLDPCLTIGTSIAEPLVAHRLGNVSWRRARVAELLEQVGLPGTAASRYPREFSGGERQRVAIARALATGPRLLVLDEPVSSLDVSVQAQVLDLVIDLRLRHRLTLILISHDLAVVRDVCHRVSVMCDGRFVESGPTSEIFARPSHPYTRSLVAAAPASNV